jgi:hypothetical protein
MKICSKCQTPKPLSEFGTYTSIKNGKRYSYTLSACKKCWNDRKTQLALEKGQDPIQSLLDWREKVLKLIRAAKDKPCAECGNSFPYYVMDLDHVRGTKKFNLGGGRAPRYGIKAVEEELEKCEPVCANCHRIRTYKRAKQ